MIPDNQSLYALRGAITTPADTPADIEEATCLLFNTLLSRNSLNSTQIVTVFFTLTADLHSASPAQICRMQLPNWENVAMMSAVEPTITGFPPHCIRVLIQFYGPRPLQHPLQPVYLREAAKLRPEFGDA